MPDAQIREPLFSELLHVLHANLDGRSDALVSGDTFIYFRDENDHRRAMASDCFVAFGPDIAQYRNQRRKPGRRRRSRSATAIPSAKSARLQIS